jgi:hypothetical protein
VVQMAQAGRDHNGKAAAVAKQRHWAALCSPLLCLRPRLPSSRCSCLQGALAADQVAPQLDCRLQMPLLTAYASGDLRPESCFTPRGAVAWPGLHGRQKHSVLLFTSALLGRLPKLESCSSPEEGADASGGTDKGKASHGTLQWLTRGQGARLPGTAGPDVHGAVLHRGRRRWRLLQGLLFILRVRVLPCLVFAW